MLTHVANEHFGARCREATSGIAKRFFVLEPVFRLLAFRMDETIGERDHGVQPLDALMQSWHLENHDLVEASPEQLNHKQVQKGRKGRQLTLHTMQKIMRALNIAIWNRLTVQQKELYFEYPHHWLFAYAKGYQQGRPDPNDPLKEALRPR